MFRRLPEAFESYCESAACWICHEARKRGMNVTVGIRLLRPAMAFTALGLLGISAVGLGDGLGE